MKKNMKTLDEIKSILALHKEELAERYKVKEIGIFGSYVKGEERRKSDVDILVEFKEPIGLFKFMDLERHLTELVCGKVDLVMKTALKPRIGRCILEEVKYI
jgi:predicted nucleotidyltransferase